MASLDDINISVLLKLEKIANNKYEEEKRRAESLISQASNMQTVFAVSSAALFMLLPVIISNKGTLSLNCIFIFVSCIVASLLLSLVWATKAQKRYDTLVLPKEKEVEDGLKKQLNDENLSAIEALRQLILNNIDNMNKAQEAWEQNNNERVSYIKKSTYAFFIAVGFCVVFYLVSLFWIYFC